jgi:SAM-dependent methyltransferase
VYLRSFTAPVGAKQRIVRWLVRSFGNPTGVGGRIAGFVMAHRSSNVQRSRWAVDLLDIRPTDRVLEVGCGPGVALKAAMSQTPHVVGVDRSPLMVEAARRRSGATVVEAVAEELPAFDAPFDKALAVNTVGHWSDPVAGLRSIHGALRPGGTIAVVSQPRGGAVADNDEVRRQLAAAGFVEPWVETLDLDPPVVCVLARRPGGSSTAGGASRSAQPAERESSRRSAGDWPESDSS